MFPAPEEFEVLRQAQARGVLLSREDWKKTSALVKEKWLDPVMSHLRAYAQDDKVLVKLLEHTRLDIKTRIEYDPEAGVAYRQGEYNVVCISLCDIAKAQYFSKLGAFFAVRSFENAQWQRIGFIYGRDLGKALANGERAPWPRIDLVKDVGLSPEHAQGVFEISSDVLFHYITWLVLHEVGHHYLKHGYGESESLKKAREEELKADLWAFDTMDEMDYSLPILEGHLVGLVVIEQAQSQAGLIVPEVQCSHPSWSTRLQQLQDLLKRNAPATSRWIHFGRAINTIHRVTGEEHFMKVGILFPRDPKRIGSVLGYFTVDGETSILATEYGDTGAYLYGRDIEHPNCAVLLHVKTPFAHSSEMDWYTTEAGQLKGVNRFEVILWSVGSYTEEEIGGVKLRDFMLLSPIEFSTNALHKVEKREDVRSEVEKLLIDVLRAQGELFLRYAKGSVPFKQIDAEWKRLREDHQTLLKAKLGNENFKKYQEEIEQNELFKLGIERLGKFITHANVP